MFTQVLCNFSGSAACFFLPFQYARFVELGQRSSFASLHKPQVLTGIIPLLEIGVSALFCLSGFLRTDGSCVCFHMSPRVLQRTFKVRWSPKPSSNAPPPAPGSDRAKARPRAGSAGSLRRLPQLPVFATVRSRGFRSRAAQPPKQKRLSRGLQLRQTRCPRGHVGRRRVT